MPGDLAAGQAYVVKWPELDALGFLADGHPEPVQLEWINRGTNQTLRPTTVGMLLRTRGQSDVSPSVMRQRLAMGLRTVFASEHDRNEFAHMLTSAVVQQDLLLNGNEGAFFAASDNADAAVIDLIASGVSPEKISVLMRTGPATRGHSRANVATAMTAGGIAGVLLGMAVIAIPGVGSVAAFGAAATAGGSSLATVGGVIGATGAAIARLLSDADIAAADSAEIERRIKVGHVFVSVKAGEDALLHQFVRSVFESHGGARATAAVKPRGTSRFFENVVPSA